MTPSHRNLSRALALVVVTCFAGSVLGPVIRGGFGYAWGYVGGIFGPIALVMLGITVIAWWMRDADYRERRESQSAEDTSPIRTAGRPDLASSSGGGREAWGHIVRRRPRRARRVSQPQR